MSRLPPDIPDFLSSVAPFSLLAREAVESLARSLQVRYHRAGEIIGRFDPPGQDGLLILRKGALDLIDSEGDLLERRGEGEILGHAIRFDPEQTGYAAKACEDCLTWKIPAPAFSAALQQHRELADFFRAGHGDRLRHRSAARREWVADLALRMPVTTSPDRPIAECAERMARHQVSCLPVIEEQRLVGIVTDRDLRNRVLARRIAFDTPVFEVMTHGPATIRSSDRIDEALVEMMRLGVHHLPVLDDQDRLVGVVSAGDLLRTQAPHPLRLVRDLKRATDRAAVVELARQGPPLLARLARDGSTAGEVGRIAGRLTDACTRRLIELAEQELGRSPMRYAWLAFGSQARLEQGLISDQDNGLALAAPPDAADADWFARFSGQVCDDLAECGYIHCPGGVMASGEWRMPVQAWRERFDHWMRNPDPDAVMRASIFFDLRVVAGDETLVESLHREVLKQASDSQLFRRFLAVGAIGHRPPIGLFRQFVQERDGSHRHGLNLKKRGVLPIVDLARVRALEGAIAAVGTEQRLTEAAKAGWINRNDADDLIHALRFIADIRLRHQATQLHAGQRPDHRVDPDSLSSLHRRYLRSAFGIVSEAQRALAQQYLL